MSRFPAALVAALLALSLRSRRRRRRDDRTRSRHGYPRWQARGRREPSRSKAKARTFNHDRRRKRRLRLSAGAVRLVPADGAAEGAHGASSARHTWRAAPSRRVDVPLSTAAEIAQTTVTAHAGVGIIRRRSTSSRDRRSKPRRSKQPRQALATLPGVSIFVQRTGHQRIPRRHLQYRRRSAAARDHLELRRDRRSEDHRLARAAHRRDSRRVRWRPHGRRSQHHQNAPTDIPQGIFGTITGGFGNQAQGIGEFDTSRAFGSERGLSQREHAKRPRAGSTRRRSTRSTTKLAERPVLPLHHAADAAQHAGVRLLESVRAVSNPDQYRSEQSIRPDLQRRRARSTSSASTTASQT